MTDTGKDTLPRMLGYQVIDVTTGEPQVYGETVILTQEVATGVLFDLRKGTTSPDLYAMIAIFPGDVEDTYGNKPKKDQFAPEFFTFTGSTGIRKDKTDPYSPMYPICDPDCPGDLSLEMQVTPPVMRALIAVMGLPMRPQSETLQQSWPLIDVARAAATALDNSDDNPNYPIDDLIALKNVTTRCRLEEARHIILDQAPGSLLPQ
jgi:hypothetical protein